MQITSSLARLGALFLVTAVTAACGGDGDRSPLLDFDPTRSSLTATPDTAAADGITEIEITARVNDDQGNGLAGMGVRFTVSGTGNTLTPASALTNSSGVATIVVTSTVAEMKQVTALVEYEGQQAAFASGTSITFTAESSPATKLAFDTQPTTAPAGQTITPSVTVLVQDEAGDTVAGDTSAVTLAIGTNPASGTLSGTSTVNAVNGVATFPGISIDAVGTGYTLTASSGTLAGATSSSFDIAAGPAARLEVTTEPGNTSAGVAISPAIRVSVVDAGGNVVATATDTITVAIGTNPSGAALSGTASATAAAGTASFADLSLDKAGAGYTLVFSSGSLTGATTAPFDITPGAAVGLAFVVDPNSAKAGDPITPQVEILDAFGNRVTGATDTVALAIDANPGPGTLGGTASVAAVAGLAQFTDLTINRVGVGYTLAATSGSLAGVSSNTFDITPGDAALLSISAQPTDAVAGAAIAPAVEVSLTDGFGNPATTATDSVTLAIDTNPGSGTLSGTATAAAVGGVATFADLSVDKVGTGYTLAATSGTLTGATTNAFTISAAAPSALAFSVEPTNAVAGVNIAPAIEVRVVDAFGNPIDTATDTVGLGLATNPGSATLSGSVSADAVAGVASFGTLSLDKAATGYTLVATSGTLTGATSATFSITSADAVSLHLTAPANATAGTPYDVIVEARDQFGNTATGYTGTVDLTSGDVQATVPAQYTFVAGDAGQKTFTAGVTMKTAGTQSLLVADAAGPPPTTDSATVDVASGPVTTLVFTGQPSNTRAGVLIAPAVEVTAFDAFANTATNFTGNINLAMGTNPTGATLAGTTSVAATAGVATFDTLTLTTFGAGYTLTASDGGTATGTSTSFDVYGEFAPNGLVITEVLHTSTTPGAAPENGRWIEIYNPTSAPLLLTDVRIEQRPNATGGVEASFDITNADVIAPGEHYVLGAAAFADNGGVPVNFVYPGSFVLGYKKHLRVSHQGVILDEVDFSDTVADASAVTHAFPDGVADQSVSHSFHTTSPKSNDFPWYWCNTAAPTPGAANDTACTIAPAGTVDFCRTQLGGPVALDTRATADVFAQFYEPTITDRFHDGNDGFANVEAQVGYGTSVTNPESTWTWSAAGYNPSYTEFDAGENNDEMTGELAITSAAPGGETFFYGFRFRLRDATSGTDGPWVYCAKEGASSNPLPAPGDGGDYQTVTVYPTSNQIAAARATPNGTGLSLPITGALVTYTRPLIGVEAAGFYVQAVTDGPALFIEVDPAGLSPVPAIGDRVSFAVTAMATAGGMRKATGITAFSRMSAGNDTSGLVQDLSTNSDLLSAQTSYGHELSQLGAATLEADFTADGTGFESAPIDTAGVSGQPNLQLRIESSIAPALELTSGCVVSVGPTPFSFSGAVTQFLALDVGDLTVQSCPAPRVVSATSTSATTVDIVFDRKIKAASVLADASQFSFDNGLSPNAATAPVVSDYTITVTTQPQTLATNYTVTVAGTITDMLDAGVDASFNVASFEGFVPTCTPTKVVVSQVYGGGGNSGALYKNDFVELHNRSIDPVDISDWSVQYAGGTGSSWQVASIPSSTMIAAGGYFLVQMRAGSGGTVDLPTPEVISNIAMAATSQKVALVNDSVELSGACPTDASIVDFVGTGSANCAETTAAGAGSNTTANIRNGTGCDDSDHNDNDFSQAAPTPRNSATAALTCDCR